MRYLLNFIDIYHFIKLETRRRKKGKGKKRRRGKAKIRSRKERKRTTKKIDQKREKNIKNLGQSNRIICLIFFFSNLILK
jgi:hypothetical protein